MNNYINIDCEQNAFQFSSMKKDGLVTLQYRLFFWNSQEIVPFVTNSAKFSGTIVPLHVAKEVIQPLN